MLLAVPVGSPSMGEQGLGAGSKRRNTTLEMTDHEYALRVSKLKIKDMVFNGWKTDQCGAIEK
ncbi:hypothetical protein OBBRIDRAFT_799096 [Obba rivulosa]|uniref:Uncharacterized protein n=1 Tax=Obba rivulosa TaxID=1052685 RepID=A0A8E2AHS5_9APHY|nr:hypothetical protein OBBRIDRAFT_799096 [Obba rivulosa]